MKNLLGKVFSLLIALALVVGAGYVPPTNGENPDEGIHPQCEEEIDDDLQ